MPAYKTLQRLLLLGPHYGAGEGDFIWKLEEKRQSFQDATERLPSPLSQLEFFWEHLKEMSAILKSKPRRIDELPRRKEAPKVHQGPLSDSEEGEEEVEAADAGLNEGGAAGSGEQGRSDMEKAIVKFTAIASKLAGPKDKHKVEALLGGGNGSVSHSENSSGVGSRKNAAATRAPQKCLVEDLAYCTK